MPPETPDAALRARLALLGVAPSPDEPELERAFTLFAERMRVLDEAADLGPADPPYLAPPAPAGAPVAVPPLAAGAPTTPPGLVESAAMVRDGTVASVALVERALAAVEAGDGRIGAFVTVLAEQAMAEAAELDADRAAGRLRGTLHGVPVAVKDLIDVAGAVTGAGSPKLADNRAAADAEVVARLRRAGAVVLGKTRTHEFAYGVLTPGTVNPWDPERIPGGSSGGSAAAVAAGMVAAAVGSDTAGSIRIPAACCGIVGFKPTYGAVPATGVWPLSWSCDHVGPLARDVADTWLAFAVLAGQGEPGAAVGGAGVAAAGPGESGPAAGGAGVAGLRLGWLVGDLVDGVGDEVATVMAEARAGLVEAGAVVDEVRLPLSVARAAAAAVVLPELAAAHARLLAQSGEKDYGPAVLAALRLGPTVLASEYLAGLRYRGRFAAQVEAVLASRDALVLPTLPVTAPRIGQATVELAGRPASVQAALTALPGPFNCSGSPVISLPAGLAAGLPVGISLVGRLGRDHELLEVARSVEAVLPRQPSPPPAARGEPPPASA